MSPKTFGLNELKSVTDFNSFADLIDADAANLAFVLYKLPVVSKYKRHDLEKKSGGLRTVYEPLGALKTYQRRTGELLANCENDVAGILNIEYSVSHAFKKQHSIFTNAKAHRHKKYVLNLDLEDFFGSINFGRIMGYLIANKHYELDSNVAKIIAHMACLNGVLVQGSPLSPVISNMVGNIIDSRLAPLCKKNRCYYSRYADDITISTRLRKFPSRFATEKFTEDNLSNTDWEIASSLRQVIEDCGFKVNQSKTRMHLNQSNQSVTGLTVNSRVNLNRKKYKLLRAQVNSYTRYGKYLLKNGEVGAPNKLRGYLDFCFWLKKNNGYFTPENSNYFVEDGEKVNKNIVRTSYEWVFYKFLFSNFFIHNEAPTIMFEGDTDYIYFKAAVKSKSAKNAERKDLYLLNQGPTVSNILGFGGGSSPYAEFLNAFVKTRPKYSKVISKNIVVIVLDNDSGLSSIKSQLKSLTKLDENALRAKDFLHLSHNLYVVLTPLGGQFPKDNSCVEDLFEEEVLERKVRGKTFDPNKKNNSNTSTYGKGIFAREIVAPNHKEIDFKNFDVIFDRISLARAHYLKSNV